MKRATAEDPRERRRVGIARARANSARAVPRSLSLGMPPPPLALTAPGGLQIRAIEALDRWITHPGHGVDPRTIMQIYKEAEWGYPQQQVDLFEDIIESDGHLRSVVEARTLAVAGKPWAIMPGGEDSQSIRAAEVLRDALAETNLEDAIAMIIAARYYGFSGTEIVWKEIDGDYVPSWFIAVPFRRFRFDGLGEARFLNSQTDLDGVRLDPGHWVFSRNTVTATLTSLTVRAGLMRTATWYSLFKRWSWRDWVIYAEKFGIPLVIGKYDEDATEEDKDALEDAVEDIGEAGQAVMSADTEIDIRESQHGGDSSSLHRAIVHESNAELSKLFTGSTLTVEAGGPGSFALGKVHETRAFDLVIADAGLAARRFRTDIARPFLHFNGFTTAKPPVLSIAVAREVDPLTRAKLAQMLSAMGLPLDTEQLREEFQFRSPPSDERTLKVPAPKPGSNGDNPAPSKEPAE